MDETHDETTSAAGPQRRAGRRIEIGIAHRDLRIVGGATQVVLHVAGYDDDDDEAAATDRDGTLSFERLRGDAELHVPDDVSVAVRQVQGDLAVDRHSGALEVHRVHGDAELHGVTAARIDTVRGELSAEDGGALLVHDVGGDATIETFRRVRLEGRVGGELALREVEDVDVRGQVGGALQLERCGAANLEGAINGDLRVEQCAAVLRIGRVGGDAEISTVREVSIGTVGGDLEIERCLGAARIGTIGGDVDAREVESLQLVTVGGDLEVERLGGRVEARQVGGDATLRTVAGQVHLGVVAGDLEVERAAAGVMVEQIGGDAELDTALSPAATCAVSAGGDVTLRLRGEVNARFVAQCHGEIHTNLPLTMERGRRRNLVGVLGRGDATVTLRAGGDIEILAANGAWDSSEREFVMSDEHEGQGPEDREPGKSGSGDARSWEGSFGGKRFRLRVEQGPGRAGVHFQGPIEEGEDPAAMGSSRSFGFEWERGRGARTYGEYEERLRDLGEKAERVARQAAEQAQDYAEKATRRARETDWESMGRELRSAITRAMSELEDAFSRVRSEWEQRSGGSGSSGGAHSGSGGSAQRVRIEHDEDVDAMGGASSSASGFSSQSSSTYAGSEASSSTAAPGAAGMSAEERDAARRQILEQLRTGALSLDEAERRLNDLR
jgi:DUF4097 and DUF4098 domain-containing protein YvlB